MRGILNSGLIRDETALNWHGMKGTTTYSPTRWLWAVHHVNTSFTKSEEYMQKRADWSCSMSRDWVDEEDDERKWDTATWRGTRTRRERVVHVMNTSLRSYVWEVHEGAGWSWSWSIWRSHVARCGWRRRTWVEVRRSSTPSEYEFYEAKCEE